LGSLRAADDPFLRRLTIATVRKQTKLARSGSFGFSPWLVTDAEVSLGFVQGDAFLQRSKDNGRGLESFRAGNFLQRTTGNGPPKTKRHEGHVK
jgi:hypothetical protein